MWDMSTLIRRCENLGHFYIFCSQLAQTLEYQTKASRQTCELSNQRLLFRTDHMNTEAVRMVLDPYAKMKSLYGAKWTNAL